MMEVNDIHWMSFSNIFTNGFCVCASPSSMTSMYCGTSGYGMRCITNSTWGHMGLNVADLHMRSHETCVS